MSELARGNAKRIDELVKRIDELTEIIFDLTENHIFTSSTDREAMLSRLEMVCKSENT